MGAVAGADRMSNVENLQDRQKVRAQSRALWEEVFEEDTPQFLDYYDAFMADHNRIYTDGADGQTVSMLHCNPYTIHMGSAEAKVSYIVAVATKKEYRHQGRMRKLLLEALTDSCREGEPFVYLMPVSERIYRPFGFRTVYYQNILTLGGVFMAAAPGEAEGTDRSAEVRAAERHVRLMCRRAERSQIPELASFTERVLSEKGVVYTKRDREYFERIWKEQEAVCGGILLFYETEDGIHGERLAGWCFTGLEDAAEAWELVLEEEGPVRYAQALHALTEYFREALPVKISGLLPGTAVAGVSHREFSWRPMTMVRITNLFSFAEKLRAKKSFACYLHITDGLLRQNDGWFRMAVSEQSGSLKRVEKESIPATESVLHATIEELTDILFGIRHNPALPAGVLYLPYPVYFNELV